MKKKICIALICVAVILILVIMGILIFLFGFNSGKKAPMNGTSVHEGMYVDGTSLKMADGTNVVLRGINHSHCWYKEADETAFDAIADTGSNCIRIVLADGKRWEADSSSEVQTVIEMARERKMIAVIEVHDATGSDSTDDLDKAVDFWISIADTLEGTENYCIINIANEWVGSWDSKLWKTGYIEAVRRLREAGIKNVLMVDAPGWGQYGRAVRTDGMEVFAADPDGNTMFSVHMYGMSGRYNWLIRYNLEGATSQNLCVCVGEFGYMHSDGDVKEEYLMEYCQQYGIGTMAWSWKGNSGGVEYLDLSDDWEGKQLSIEWGEKVVNGEYGIRNTSVIVLGE